MFFAIVSADTGPIEWWSLGDELALLGFDFLFHVQRNRFVSSGDTIHSMFKSNVQRTLSEVRNRNVSSFILVDPRHLIGLDSVKESATPRTIGSSSLV